MCTIVENKNALLEQTNERTEVAVEAGADVVAVEAVHVLAPPQHQLLLQGLRDRALAAAAQPRHPQGGALLPNRRVPLGPREVARLAERKRGGEKHSGWGGGGVVLGETSMGSRALGF